MAKRKNIGNSLAEFTLNLSEQIALQQILDKVSRDKSLTTLDAYRRAGQFHQLFDINRDSGEYRIST